MVQELEFDNNKDKWTYQKYESGVIYRIKVGESSLYFVGVMNVLSVALKSHACVPCGHQV